MAGETPGPDANPGPAGRRSWKAGAAGPGAGAELRERLDQIGAILAKGLDLAEAGVSLGVTILSRLGRPPNSRSGRASDSAARAHARGHGRATAGPPAGPDAPAESREADLRHHQPTPPDAGRRVKNLIFGQ